ncbi:hypothetical protein ACFPJ1_26530 [Kribbella qitaiheensis]|uniref:hypothetical protein n=1 Tax=Kribbella qitaiheensis TaxID=1544730 RepID=UPI003609AE58
MIRRPLLPAAALCATLALAACNNSPEAGRPDATPPSTPTTATPTAPTTPIYTAEEQAAIAAAKARYVAARAAVDNAFANPTNFNRAALVKAGVGGNWILAVTQDVSSLKSFGWYRAGRVKIPSTQVDSVKLDNSQPEVRLTNCIDTSAVVTRFRKDNKPVPMGPGNGKRHRFKSQLVYASPSTGGPRIWFLIEDKAAGAC